MERPTVKIPAHNMQTLLIREWASFGRQMVSSEISAGGRGTITFLRTYLGENFRLGGQFSVLLLLGTL